MGVVTTHSNIGVQDNTNVVGTIVETQHVVGIGLVVQSISSLLGALNVEQTQVQLGCYAMPLA
jgi:hypothetical protein